MKKSLITLVATPLVFLFFSIPFQKLNTGSESPNINKKITLCSVSAETSFPFLNHDASAYFTIPDHFRFVNPIYKSGFPKVIANDNRTAAGKLNNNKLTLHLQVMWADFHMETNDRTGLRVVAIAEKGKAPSIPAPLIRVKTGTMIDVLIENVLKDSTITVYGLQKRPSEKVDSLYLKPGEKKRLTFEAGDAGTYLYWVKLGRNTFEEEDQLAGAFIIDPKDGSPPDRVFVINIFSTAIDPKIFPARWAEALTINGKSWPFTEPLKFKAGDSVSWRVINASQRPHPMHLHGFYFNVLSKGTMLKDKPFKSSQRKFVVTEDLNGRETMNMKWEASRPGNWLFHCHLSWHIITDLRLPGARELDPPEFHDHMAGIVLGFEIAPGKTDILYKGERRDINLFAKEYADLQRNGFSVSGDPNEKLKNTSPGPLLLLTQYQPTFVTLTNQMKDPTSIHWHGLEIESWSDGVPDYSSSDGKMSPVVNPGESFTYKLATIRPGTFIYHSHMNDAHQLAQGLYGPLIVLPEGQTFNPDKDHIYIVGHKSEDPKSILDMELNGSFEQPDLHASVHETHRLRLININPADQILLYMTKGDKAIPVKFIAKDGADLPSEQQIMVEQCQKIGVGQTADFEFKPDSPGVYTLHVKSSYWENGWEQKWVVEN